MSKTAPTFENNVITIPDVPGVEYKINGYPVKGQVEIQTDTQVSVRAERGYKLAPSVQQEHEFKFERPSDPTPEGDSKDSDKNDKVAAGDDASAVQANVPSGAKNPVTQLPRTTQP